MAKSLKTVVMSCVVLSENMNRKLPKLVLVGGFPDDCRSAWSNEFIEKLCEHFRVYSICLPDFDKERRNSWGYTFDEVTEALHEAILSNVGSEPVYLVGHDWGSMVCQLYENNYSNSVNKLCLLDVGQGTSSSLTDILRILLYQFWFAWAFLVSQAVNYELGNFIFHCFALMVPSILRVSPHDVRHRPVREINVSLCYPYFQFWKAAISGNMVRPNFPHRPTLYMYGTRKNTLFHSEEFVLRLGSTNECKTVALDAGHWVTHFCPDECAGEILAFFR